MSIWRAKRHEIDRIDHAHLQLRQIPAQKPSCRDCLQSCDIASAGQHNIGVFAIIVAAPLPGSSATSASKIEAD